MRKVILFTGAVLVLTACHNNDDSHDASGVFEATEIVVSALTSGQILQLNIDEGTEVAKDDVVGTIDCDDLSLQKSQLEASREALRLKQVEAAPEIDVLNKQIATQEANIATLKTQLAIQVRERDRISRLVKADAAPAKQLDDIQGQVDILENQIIAQQSNVDALKAQVSSTKRSVAIQNRGVLSEDAPFQARIDQVENQITNCEIVNPINGVVIAKYIEPFEFVSTGKPVYKVADLNNMTLRAYLTGDQISSVQLGQEVTVLTDNGEKEYKAYPGKISWISDEAEFTPKTIQTKNERANLVYAVKISVPNDGYIRIGMYGEIDF